VNGGVRRERRRKAKKEERRKRKKRENGEAYNDHFFFFHQPGEPIFTKWLTRTVLALSGELFFWAKAQKKNPTLSVKLSRIQLTLLIHAMRHWYSLRDAGYVVARHGSIEGMNEYIMRWIANEVAYI